MVEDRIGYRYAKSAFALAQERKELDAAQADMAMIHEVCNQNPDFLAMLQSPIINGQKKLEILTKIFAGKFQTKLVPLLLEMLTQKGREKFLFQVTTSFMALYDEVKGIVRGKLTSATALPEATVASIRKDLEASTGKAFHLETSVDPDLIGGFTLKVGDRLFDGSVSASLRRLKQHLS